MLQILIDLLHDQSNIKSRFGYLKQRYIWGRLCNGIEVMILRTTCITTYKNKLLCMMIRNVLIRKFCI